MRIREVYTIIVFIIIASLTLKSRPIISAFGLLIGLSLLITVLLTPFQLVGVPDTSDFGLILGYIGTQLITNPLFIMTFLCA